jgi:raffinose/stachyose/melibiose transport system permease protein
MRRRGFVYFIVPALFLVFLFFIVPNVLNFVYSFTDWSTYRSEVNFVGLKNLIELFDKEIILRDLITTIEYAFLVTIFMNLLALVLALALEVSGIFNGIMRTIFFIPVLISPLAAGYIFRAFFGSRGVINQFLSILPGMELQINLLGSFRLSLFIVVLVHCWKFMGVPLLVYIAGLNMVPDELVESAKIEGANGFQIIKNIKIPLIGPAITFNVSLSLIGALSIFDLVLAMTKGGPGRATEVLNMYILTSFSTGRFGFTTSISLMLFLTIVFLGVPLILFLRKREIEL